MFVRTSFFVMLTLTVAMLDTNLCLHASGNRSHSHSFVSVCHKPFVWLAISTRVSPLEMYRKHTAVAMLFRHRLVTVYDLLAGCPEVAHFKLFNAQKSFL